MNYQLIVGLLVFIGICLLVRNDTKITMKDREWLRTLQKPLPDTRSSIEQFKRMNSYE